MTHKLQSNSIANSYIEIDTLDQLIDSIELDGILVLDNGLEMNNFLNHSTKEDGGLAEIDGSIHIQEDRLAYFGHDTTPTETKGYDFIILQTDKDGCSTFSLYRKDTHMFNHVLTKAF